MFGINLEPRRTSEQVVTLIQLAEMPRVAGLRHAYVEDMRNKLII